MSTRSGPPMSLTPNVWTPGGDASFFRTTITSSSSGPTPHPVQVDAHGPESGILSLAPELLQSIADELDVRDVRNLRLVCRHLSSLLGSIVFRNVTLSVTKNTLASDLNKLRTLASATTRECAASYATQTLSIGALSPCFDPTYTGPTWKFVDDEWVAEEEPQDHEGMSRAMEEIQALIVPAISSLQGLQSVTWKPVEKDDSVTQARVMDAISRRAPNLRSVHLTLSHCKIPVSFDHFSRLASVSIAGTSQKHHPEIFDNLARMIARCSDTLRSIDIVSNWRYYHGIDRTQSLHQLFKYCAADSPPVRLRHLGLQMCLVKLDATTLPHLRHLKSLRLTHVEDPYTRAQYTIEDEESGDSALRTEQKECGSSLAEFWATLRQTGIQLEDVTLDVVVPSFLDYLVSYSGLRSLHLTPGRFKDAVTSDLMAETFFARALPKHAGVLEDLDVNAPYEGRWSFGSHNRQILSQCCQLRTLRMSLIETQDSNNVAHLLDTVCLSMPRLQSLDIFSTTAEKLRSAYCGSPIMAHLMRTTRAIAQNVERYKPPSSSHLSPRARCQLPEVTVSSDKVFIVQDARFVDSSPAKTTSGHDCWRYQSYVSFC